MPTKAERLEEIEQARETLRELLPPGTTMRTILRHCSRSGMTRAISPVYDDQDISWLAVRAVPGWHFNSRYGGITMGGCGMDMGFSLVYTLSRTLYGGGFDCIGEGDSEIRGLRNSQCPSNDHSNGDRDYSAHWHDDGGYALRHDWL